MFIVKNTELQQKAISALGKCVNDIPFLEIIPESPQPQLGEVSYDLLFTIKINNKQKKLFAEIKSNGEPRYARQAANQLALLLQGKSDAYGIFIAPYISQQSAQICKQSGIGYVDLTGNCYLSFEQIYIRKEGIPNPRTEKRRLRSLYSPKAERILRVLLSAGPRAWQTDEISIQADVSYGLVAKVKDLLLDREWIKAHSIGFSLTQPFLLLEDWRQNYDFGRNESLEFYTMLDPAQLEYQLADVCGKSGIKYGLTGFSGATRYAPAVRYQRAMAYVAGDMDVLIQSLNLKPVSSGSNIILLKPYDTGVFYQSKVINGVSVISPIQIYLDLVNIRGRGEEAAQAIMEKVINKIW
jgi:hypothetical protein